MSLATATSGIALELRPRRRSSTVLGASFRTPGQVQAFFPLWLQKSFGPWATYGGGGFWLNPGAGNRHWWYAGWQAQSKFMDQVALGVEIFYASPKAEDGGHEIRFNVGLVTDFGPLHHLLLSAGRGILGPNRFMGYLAYQLTVGPAPSASEHPSVGSASTTIP